MAAQRLRDASRRTWTARVRTGAGGNLACASHGDERVLLAAVRSERRIGIPQLMWRRAGPDGGTGARHTLGMLERAGVAIVAWPTSATGSHASLR